MIMCTDSYDAMTNSDTALESLVDTIKQINVSVK